VRRKTPDEWTHGTRTTYQAHGCRCGACAHANRIYIRNYNACPERRAYNQQYSRDYYYVKLARVKAAA
jgi:hypothetical protein